MSQWDGEATGTTSNEKPRLLRGWLIVLCTCVVLSLFLGGLESTAQPDKQNSEDFPEIFEDVSRYLKHYYLDLDRISPRPLVEKAFGAIEYAVDEIYIENSDPKNPIITVHVESKSESFNLESLEDLDDAVKMLEGVFHFIKKNYRGETPINDIRYAAVNGFLTGIDPHTLVFSPEDFKDFSVHIEGEICGVGMYVGTRDGKLTVIEVLKGTPAFKAGFKKGDLIAKIGDESTINMTVSEAVEKIRGVCKTSVTLSVKRPSVSDSEMLETIAITVERDRVVIKSVESKLITDWSSDAEKPGSETPAKEAPVTEVRAAESPWQGGVGYVQVINFDKNTTTSLRNNLDRLQVENGGKPLAGLILDMRNNSGGLLTQAVDMCDLFLDSGSIVITASKREKLNTQEAKESGDEPDYPIVVLSNEASASGAEIVIGALQKNNRAIVVGTRTFGKGSVQQLHQLRHDAQLKITVSEYLIPGKISIQENGVVPNIMALAVVDDGELDLFQNERSLTERNYERHIVSRYAKEESPDYTLRYLLDPVENDPYNDRFMSGELEPGKDKLVQIALSVLRLAGKPYRPGDILKEKRTEIEKLKDSLFADIEARLKEKGIDWSAGSSDAPTSIEPGELEMVLSREFIQEPSKEKDDPVPVNKVQVTARLSNKGNRTFYRMKGLSRSDYFLYKDRELLFGKLEPGQTLERSAKVRLPYFPFTRNDIFTVELSATGDLPQGDGQAANTVLLSAGIPIEIKDTGRPSFAYSAEILEEGGEGEAPKSISALREGLDAIFRVKIKNSGNAPAHKGVAILRNETGRQVFLNKGRIDFSNLAPKGETEVEFRFEVRSGEPLVEYDFELMVADSYSNAAISRKFTVPGTGKGLTKPFPNGVEFSAPTITALLVDPESREMVITTEKDTVNLEAMIQSQSPEHFKAWIFNSVVGNHELTADKIFFANSQGESQLKIATPVPLKKGINLFTVVSNGRDGLESRQNIVVRRE